MARNGSYPIGRGLWTLCYLLLLSLMLYVGYRVASGYGRQEVAITHLQAVADTTRWRGDSTLAIARGVRELGVQQKASTDTILTVMRRRSLTTRRILAAIQHTANKTEAKVDTVKSVLPKPKNKGR